MNAKIAVAALVLALASLVVSITGRKGAGDVAVAGSGEPLTALDQPGRDGTMADLEARLQALEALGGRLGGADESIGGGDSPHDGRSFDERLAEIESAVAKLNRAYEGISLEASSEERDALFRAEDGYLKADEYFAAEKFAIAGEGYLAFLESHPDHPEAYDILKRARQAFLRAGYEDKAIWAQEQLLANLGDERRATDVATLARLEKQAGHYDDAIEHASEAAELSLNPTERLWNRMYWAWYHQLRDGEQAGLDAYREVEREIEAAGQSEGKLGVQVRAKIAEIERASGRAPRSVSR